MEELISQTETMRVRSALEELPKDVFQDICGYIPAVAQAFFALAVTNKQFKDFMDTPRCLIVFALCSTFGCGVERNVAAGRKFYAKAAANGSMTPNHQPSSSFFVTWTRSPSLIVSSSASAAWYS